MSQLEVTDVLAKAFVAEGVDHLFTLMGDANMYWSAKMAEMPGVRVVHARHEHCTCSMAHGYHLATGKVGVASTTCGPGFTQIMTGLSQAARGNIPMVVFAGDSPIGAAWYLQEIDMGPLARGTGAHFIAIKSIDRALDNVREAFHIANTERRPVVLSVPMDLQRQQYPYMADYTPSSDLAPIAQRPHPDPDLVARIADMIVKAERPIIIGGRGAVASGARDALDALAERAGALVATTLLGKGLFDGNPFALDIAGAFSSDYARERFAESDLVIGFGASLGNYTTEAGYLFPAAQTVQVDIQPRGLWQGLRTADLHVSADARATAEALVQKLDQQNVRNVGFRSNEIAAQIASDVPDSKAYEVQANTVDPRKAIVELDNLIPKDWDVVIGGGHYFSIALTHLQGRAPEKYHVIVDFGGIGSGLPAAIGVAAARNNGKVVLIEGDGSLLMHVQELETLRRSGIKLLIAVMNDGGYGAEFHKFRAHGLQAAALQATHGRGDLAAMANGFGLNGSTVNRNGAMGDLFSAHLAGDTTSLWDVHTDDLIPSRAYRRIHYGEA
ncbi:MAG: acetolactate synthase-1/2/3 large subunit [Gammaproteobacteria bacterium]|jgi:acetolactate synthase-1/2/3 large subunit